MLRWHQAAVRGRGHQAEGSFIIGILLNLSLQFLCQRAFEALSASTHLYGRRLVLEWAKDEDTIETLRKRTADHFHGSILFAVKLQNINCLFKKMEIGLGLLFLC